MNPILFYTKFQVIIANINETGWSVWQKYSVDCRKPGVRAKGPDVMGPVINDSIIFIFHFIIPMGEHLVGQLHSTSTCVSVYERESGGHTLK